MNTVMSNTDQRKRIMRLFKYDEEVKKDAIKQFTLGRTDSLRNLTQKEADFLLTHLEGKHRSKLWSMFDKHNQQHRHVLSLCIQYGWSSTNGDGKELADLVKLHNWLRENPKCPVRKPLKEMDKIELSKIIIALEGMIKWKFK